jgi:hypothetical protein
MLPGLLFGAASIAKEQGLFGTPGLTPQELAGNNDVWKRLGQRPQMEQEGPQMADMPQATPGLSLAGSAPLHAMLPPMSVGAPPQAPVAGLLSDPNEQQRRAFFQSQGIGPAAQFAMR